MIDKHPASRTLVMRTVGNLDALKVEHYRQKLRSLISSGYRHLILDLEQTQYMNSSALGLIVEIYNTIRHQQGTFKLVNCQPQVRSLLKQSRLDQLFWDGSSEWKETEVEPNYEFLNSAMSEEIFTLAHLKNAAERILSLFEPEEVAREILSNIIQVMRGKRGAVFLLDPTESYCSLAAWQDESGSNSWPIQEYIPLTHGRLEYQILMSDGVLRHKPTGSESINDLLFRRLQFKDLIAATIRGQQRRYGFVAVEPGPDHSSKELAGPTLLQTFTNLCGLALERALLFQQVGARNQQLAQALDQLRATHQSLIDAGRLAALGTVISALGHQLNNKMVPLLGYAQLLHGQTDLPGDVARKISSIYDATKEIHHVIDKLLRVSRVRENLRQPLNPQERLHVALDLLSRQIEQEQIEVHLEKTEEPVQVLGDSELFLQALLAVLHRSCTSFDEGCTERAIFIRTSVEGQRYRILIEDTGDGLDRYDREDWLDPLVPFEAMDHGRIFNYTLPRNIVMRHNGVFTVEDGPLGGKRILIDLPIDKTPVPCEDFEIARLTSVSAQ